MNLHKFRINQPGKYQSQDVEIVRAAYLGIYRLTTGRHNKMSTNSPLLAPHDEPQCRGLRIEDQ